MERRVQRARGDRTAEEKRDLEQEIAKAQAEYDQKVNEHKLLSKSIRQLDDDLRAIKRDVGIINEEKEKLTIGIEELTLENDMTAQDLGKIVKIKEETLVQHDIMKLEIKNIRDNLMKATYKVYNLENRKYQLEMSMQEREKEISVHHDVLKAESKAAEEERHKIAVELSERLNKVKNLKIKYESLVQKNQPSDGSDNVHDHSQAYYVIKAAQEREELQRKGDELNAKIIQSEKELKALDNTLNHLKNRNSNYRDGFLNKGTTAKDFETKESLEQQMRAASENLFKKKKDYQQKTKEYDEDIRRYNEIQNKLEVISQKNREVIMQVNKLEAELQDQLEKRERAQKSVTAKTSQLRSLNVHIDDNQPRAIQIKLDIEKNLTKTLQTALYTLCNDFPELASVTEPLLKEKGLSYPEKPASSIDLGTSVKSGSSRGSSIGSRGRNK
jgi:chromosome segregation ATPase